MKIIENTGEFKRPRIFYVIAVGERSHVIHTKHLLYNLRYKMIQRCYNAKLSDYESYQGKGIRVCEEWRNNPESFFEFCLKNGWKKGLQLDRIDPNGNYEPSNVRMVTASVNSTRSLIGRIGENARNVKLDTDKVKKIKRMFSEGITNYRIAKEFDLAASTIANIRHGRTWSHVKED